MLVALGLALRIAPAHAAIHGEVTDFGETTAEVERPARTTRQDHTLAPRTLIEGIRYVSHTSNLTAKLCLRFGVSARLTAEAGEYLPAQLIVVATHPPLTSPTGVTGTRNTFPTPALNGSVYAGYTFGQAWELQPGEWTFTFQADGMTVASKTFTVTVPMPHESICDAETS